MPGLGKTTLAKAVSNAEKIREKFGENVLWVSVSRIFEAESILKKMLEYVCRGNELNVMGQEALMRKLSNVLGEKNYLLILDDVWNEERLQWELLRNCLVGVSKNKGNQVLVTTRSNGVALVMAHAEEHILFPKGLQEVECWAVIKQRAFGSASVQDLEEVGMEISRKCQGIPLVASLIGATLQNKTSRRDWQSVLNNQVWRSLERENGILDIVKISYDHPPELALKQCFAFCSIFPQDSVMEKEILIQLWMALGFLQSSEECSMEDNGNKYFQCLLSYSLFQEEEQDILGRVKSCRMHDLIHDFAKSISNSETMILEKDSGNAIPGHARHVNLIYGEGMAPTDIQDAAEKLQTLFLKCSFAKNVQKGFKRVRILDFSDATDVEQFKTSFNDSKNLRYLDISGTELEEFPKFVKKLYKLQTLRFMNCKSLKMPPEGLCSLINLRHIYFDDEKHVPANLGRLTDLQTLQLFVVGTTEGSKIEELGSLSKLKGSLEIRKLEFVKGKSEAESAKLFEKAVDELVLSWSDERDEAMVIFDEDTLEGLRPHPDLQRLNIDYFAGENLPSWMLKSTYGGHHFNNMLELQLRECRKLKSIPIMEGFNSLRLLSIEYCDELIEGTFAFPSIQELSIEHCPKLETLTVSGLSSLENLCMYECGVVRFIGDDLSCSRLKVLNLISCRNLEFLPSLYKLSALQVLSICYSDKLERLPSGLSFCTALEVLAIEHCKNLISTSEELKGLRSLVKLIISYCPKLSSFPEEILGCLTSLKTLKIGGFSNELEDFPGLGSIHSLHGSLENLAILGWENLTQLPPRIQHLTALQELYIWDFSGLQALTDWFGDLPSSLQYLHIDVSGNLKQLPSKLVIECLSKFKHLHVFPDWPELKEKLQQVVVKSRPGSSEGSNR